MKQKRNLVIAIVLSAVAGVLTLHATRVFAPAPDAITPAPQMETAITEPPVPETCAYVWAYHDASELTEKLDGAVKALNPNAHARASLYGEDCVYTDRRSTFGAMETDFYIHAPADDLSNEEALGNWMAQVMPIVSEIPREEIQGNYGFVEFWFEKNEAEHIIVHLPIQKYMDEVQKKTGVELFRMFYIAP